MADLLTRYEGLSRYPTQQVLYEWKKNETRLELPHGAFLGQVDEYADGDIWVISQATEALGRGQVLRVSTNSVLDRDMSSAYNAGDYTLNVTNPSATAIEADRYAGALIGIYNGTSVPLGASSRIIGNSAAGDSIGANFEIYLAYPFAENIPVTVDFEVTYEPWNGVRAISAASHKYAVGWTGVAVTANHYFWMKVSGDVMVESAGGIQLHDSVTASGTSTHHGRVAIQNNHDDPVLGIARKAAGASGQWIPITLNIGY